MGHGSMCNLVLLSRGKTQRIGTLAVARGPGECRVEAESPCTCEKLIMAAVLTEMQDHEAVAEGCSVTVKMGVPLSHLEVLITLL